MITKDVVKHVANLARLELTDSEVEQYCSQMGAIMAHFEELSKIDTKGIQPLVSPSPIQQHMREDRAIRSLTVEQALQNAPESSGHLFKVPPVV